jgi:hypothetical protein
MANLVVFWIEVLVLVVVICLLGMIARTIAKSQSGLDKKELAVVRPAAGRGLIRFDPSLLLILALCSGPLGLLLSALWCFAYYKHRAAVKKVVGFDPREQNSAEGVTFSFYELRITRAELIKGYEKNAQRILCEGSPPRSRRPTLLISRPKGQTRSSCTPCRMTFLPVSTSGARGSSPPS